MKRNYGYRVASDKEMIYDPLFEGDSIFDDEKQEAWEIQNNKHWNKGGITLAALKNLSLVVSGSAAGGLPGPQGIQGVPGSDGADGANGTNGTNGTDGSDGSTGTQGVSGIDGIDGTNGTGVVIKGHDSLANIYSIDGDAGDMWIDDATGHGLVSNGLGADAANWLDIGQIEGPAGPTGLSGTDGSQGIPGVNGAPGTDGVDGSDGGQGIQGIDGPQGLPGADVSPVTEAQIDLNKIQLAKLNPDPSEIFVTGQNPIAQLEIDAGGTTAQLQVMDKTSGHAVASVEYTRSTEELYFALMNKTSGAWRTLLALKPDGTATIGNGMTQHQIATLADPQPFDILDYNGVDLNNILSKGIHYVDGINKPSRTTTGMLEVKEYVAGGQLLQTFYADNNFKSFHRVHDGNGWSEWKEDDVAHVIGLMMSMIIGKASKTSLPTIYSGDTTPLDSMGKDLDWYHHFEAGSSIDKVLYDSTTRQNYHPNLFALAADYLGDVAQNDIVNIELAPTNHVAFIELGDNATLPIEDLTLEILNHGDAPVDIPITVLSNAAGEFMGTYSISYDAVIAKIVGTDGTNPSSFKIKVKEGVSTNKEYDYQKHNGTWKRTDFLNNDKVNELIREYNTTVIMTLVNPIKPTRLEALAAFKILPHFDWTKDDSFFIREAVGDPDLVFVDYQADGATNEATAGMFFYRALAECS